MILGRLFSFLRDKEHAEKREFLMQLPIFQGLRRNDLTHLAQVLEERAYLKGETLFCEGDIGRALFIVASGNVQLTRKTGGADAVIAEVRPCEIFGEMALLEEMPRTAGAIASEKTKVYLLYKNRLENLMLDYPGIGVVIVHYLARTLSSRLRAIMEKQSAPTADK